MTNLMEVAKKIEDILIESGLDYELSYNPNKRIVKAKVTDIVKESSKNDKNRKY